MYYLVNEICGATTSPDADPTNDCNLEDTPIRHPGLVVTKTGDNLSKEGDVVTYVITVCNTGDVTLLKNSVTDTLITNTNLAFNNVLYSTICETHTFTHTVTAAEGTLDYLTNTVTATYRVSLDPARHLVTTDAHIVHIVHPSLTLTKTADTPLSKEGDVVTYTITLTNTGDVTLTCSITDSLIPITPTFPGDVSPGQIIQYIYPYTVPAGYPDPLTNTVIVTCQVHGLPNILTDTVTHAVDLVHPCLAITKTGDARSKISDTVTYTITVCNCGDVPLIKQDVGDSLIGGVDAAFAPSLLPGGCETNTFTYTVQPGDPDPLVNAASACYKVEGLDNTLHEIDYHSVDLVHPGLTVTKTGSLLSKAGDIVTYAITVCNTGDVTLLKQAISDTLITDVYTAFAPSLPPSPMCESHIFTRTVMITDPHPLLTNTITISYQVDGLPNIITRTDSHTVILVRPQVVITKMGPDCAYAGDTITYTFRITNTSPLGSPDLILNSVTDTLMGNLTPIVPTDCITLPVGDSCHFTTPYTVPNPFNDPLTNTVTITYNPLGFNNDITATDTHVVRRCSKLYVANEGTPGKPGTIEVFKVYDIDHIEHVKTITDVGEDPCGMTSYDKYLSVADLDEKGPGALYSIDMTGDTVTDSITLPSTDPRHPHAHPVRMAVYDGYAYIARHSGGPPITRVPAEPPWTSTVDYSLPPRPSTDEYGFFGATADTKRGHIYFTKRNFGSTGIWRLTSPTGTLEYICSTDSKGDGGPYPTDKARPFSILYHPTTDRVYVAFGLIDELWVFDPHKWPASNPNACITETRVMTIATGYQDPTPDAGHGGQGLAALGQCVFVSNYLSKSVTAVIYGSCVEGSPAGPYRVYLPIIIKSWASGSTGGRFTSESISHNLASAPIKVTTIGDLKGQPTGMTAELGHYLFVTLPLEDKVAIIDTKTLTVIGHITVTGDHPHTVILAGGN